MTRIYYFKNKYEIKPLVKINTNPAGEARGVDVIGRNGIDEAPVM